MQLIFRNRWDPDKLYICARGKSILEFRSVWKEIQKSKKLKHSKKVPKNGLTQPPFGEYVYLIRSTSMQKENPFWNSIHQIKIRCAKYKFAERSHNFLMELPMHLIFGVRWDLDKLQICAKGKSILEFFPWERKSKKSKKLKHSKKVPKNGLTEPPFGEYVYLIRSTSMQKENPFWNSVRQIKIRCAKYKVRNGVITS